MDEEYSRRIARMIEPFRVTRGSKMSFAHDFDPSFEAGIELKRDASKLEEGVGLVPKHHGPRHLSRCRRASGTLRRPQGPDECESVVPWGRRTRCPVGSSIAWQPREGDMSFPQAAFVEHEDSSGLGTPSRQDALTRCRRGRFAALAAAD